MSNQTTQHSCYHTNWAKSPKALQQLARKVTKEIREKGVEFDAIACRGVSGIVVSSAVASRLAKQLIVVRKPDEKSHSECEVEGRPYGDFKYIVIDDFICTGKTVVEIMKPLVVPAKYQLKGVGKCVGLFMYSDFIRCDRGWKDDTRVQEFEERAVLQLETA